ncbi:F-box/TPR repeat protein pof3 [Lasiodiplodia hormozganensis]|uniref:F-box/TPR repeat protein pof3 n=1 Tax=Lasiodiplodia hormozganensis TaxID=869390 RepID=A0AA39YJT4_9PEZI|nr:F-box/TPR repeat protein pof3 [Lasiodiplodia hormozganensis]
MPHPQSAAELLELGKAFYAQRNYERALKAFTDAFAASASSDIKFLDMAVACHIKLDDLNSALSLSRKITKHAPKDCRGYLRMGQVLQLQEKPEMALEVYKLGLRRCPSEDPEKLHLMQAKRDELTRRLAKPKSQDPIVVLPAEIMDLVMGHLNFKQRVACRKLEALEFLGSELSGSSIKDPVASCIGLRSLKLGKSAVITLDAVTQILKGRLTLVTAEFENVEARRDATWDTDLPNLQTLSLGAGSVQEIGVHVLSMHQLVDRIPNIRSLVLTGWKYHMGLAVDANFSGLQHLETLHLNNTFFAWQPRLPKSVKHLTLTASWGWSSTLSIQRMVEINLPAIEELNYINEGSERDTSQRFIHTLLHKMDSEVTRDTPYKIVDGEALCHLDNRSLRKFLLERCPSGSSGELIKILTDVPRLHGTEDLTLVQAEFNDEVAFAQAIIDNYRNLKRLSIPSCKITGVGIKMLIKELRDRAPSDGGEDGKRARQGLEYLNVDWCTSISPDAVEWARGQGVEVSWKTTVPKPSGKKIRYA